MPANYDTAITAGLDSSGVEAGTKAMDRDMKAFATGAEKSFQKVAKSAQTAEKHYDRVNAAAQRARQAESGGKGAYRVSQIAMQAQDVAVQLQGGAKYATVIAQQGSQVASAFGPYGAILGGVLAIGASLIGWATAEEKAQKKAEEFNATLEKTKELSDFISQSIFQNQDETENIKARLRGGEVVEQQLIRQKAMARELGEVWERYSHSGYNDASGNAKMGVSLEDARLTQDLIRQKYAAKDVEEVEGRIVHLIEKSAGGYHAAAVAAEARLSAEKQLEQAEEKHAKLHEQAATEREHEAKAAQQLLEHGRQLAALATKGLHGLFDQYGLQAQSKELAKQVLSAQAIATAATVARGDALLNPGAAKAEAKKAKAEIKADRTIAERDANAKDNRALNHAGRAMSPAQRAAFIKNQTDRTHEQRHPKQAISINPADLDALADKIATKTAAENAKLLWK